MNNALEQADKVRKIYGIISTIDGEMRLRLRGTENFQKSSSDRRYVKRGKNIRSIRKKQLLEILSYIGEPSADLARQNIRQRKRLFRNSISGFQQ